MDSVYSPLLLLPHQCLFLFYLLFLFFPPCFLLSWSHCIIENTIFLKNLTSTGFSLHIYSPGLWPSPLGLCSPNHSPPSPVTSVTHSRWPAWHFPPVSPCSCLPPAWNVFASILIKIFLTYQCLVKCLLQDALRPDHSIWFLLLQKSHILLKPIMGHLSYPTWWCDYVFWRQEDRTVCCMWYTFNTCNNKWNQQWWFNCAFSILVKTRLSTHINIFELFSFIPGHFCE